MPWKPDYVTSDDLFDYTHSAGGDPTDGPPIGLAVTVSSRAVDNTCNRQFGQVAAPEARLYTPQWNREEGVWEIEVDDFMTTAGLMLAFDSQDDRSYSSPITVYDLLPANAAPKGRPWERIVVPASSGVQPCARRNSVRATIQWGWSAVPAEVKQATLMQGSRFFMRRNAPFGVAGSPDQGSELRLLARVDPDVEVGLRSVVRWWGAR